MAKSQIHRTIFIIIVLLFIYISQSEAGNFINPTPPGYRYYSQEFKGDKHSGIDITGKSRGLIEDKPAFAVKDGKVIYSDWQTYVEDKDNPGKLVPLKDGKDSGYGKMVIVDHEDGTISVYEHFKRSEGRS